jgi:hypothetical protein
MLWLVIDPTKQLAAGTSDGQPIPANAEAIT